MRNRTSWENVSKWYDKSVGNKGHYYHEHVILPKLISLMNLKNNDKVIDIACGQGVLAKNIPPQVEYTGFDISKSLIDSAIKTKRKNQNFIVHNAEKLRKDLVGKFTKATIILALQNIEKNDLALEHASKYLVKGGELFIVLNHPCFRIPRQSSWEIDKSKKTEYRRIDRYLSKLEIPITADPGRGGQKVTWSFHFSIQDLTNNLVKAGFLIERIEEWISDKESQGKAAKMENRSRREFPMFMAVKAIRL